MREILKNIQNVFIIIFDFVIKLLNGININKIKIKQEFKNTYPSAKKIKEKAKFYCINGYFKDNVIIDENNILIDGYITYLIAKHWGFKYLEVQRVKLKNK